MNKKSIVAGFILMLIGGFLLLNKIGLFMPHVYHIIISWQMLLIAIGVIFLFDKKQDQKTVGIILLTVGIIFLLPKIYPLNVAGFIIPVALIAIGITFIIKSAKRNNRNNFSEIEFDENSNRKSHFSDFGKNTMKNNGGVVHKEYVFTGSKEKWTEGKLRNLEIEATFSGVELDFSQAELADDIKVAAHIKVTSVFSGVIIYVPDDWNIMVQKTGVFGGFNDNRPNRVLKVESDKYVVIELEAVFGGGELRCYE